MRNSDPDAAVYWVARMLEAGEDPLYIARRLVRFASEDVGNADPRGLLIATAAWDAVERVGLPECQLNLSHAVCYLATAPKSNACCPSSVAGSPRTTAEIQDFGPNPLDNWSPFIPPSHVLRLITGVLWTDSGSSSL